MDKKIKAVLFDYDGVIADTMEDNYLAWKTVLKKRGIILSRDDYFPFEGIKLEEIIMIIEKKNNIFIENKKELISEKDETFLRNNIPKLYPGVEEFISELKRKNIKLAIVSAGHFNRLSKSLSKDFMNNFSSIITGDKIKEGKPSPEPYLKAIQELNLKSDDCVVIENAPVGITSAKRAKVNRVIAITSTLKKELLYEADDIIDSFIDLKDLDIFKRILSY
ncbi:MAG: HAD family phosphatase [Nanoarchaeota archaeon]|nr:HAD family phosphatase [Nanoarchaeota archaeon]